MKEVIKRLYKIMEERFNQRFGWFFQNGNKESKYDKMFNKDKTWRSSTENFGNTNN